MMNEILASYIYGLSYLVTYISYILHAGDIHLLRDFQQWILGELVCFQREFNGITQNLLTSTIGLFV